MEGAQPEGLDADQLNPLLAAVGREFHEHGRWPEADRLQRTFARHGEAVEVWQELNRLGRRVAFVDSPGNRIVLTVVGMAGSGACDEELQALVKVVELAVEAYFDRDDREDAGPASIAEGQLRDDLGLDPQMVDKLRIVLDRFGHLINGFREEDGVRRWLVSESAYRFRDVHLVSDLIAKLESETPALAVPALAIDAASLADSEPGWIGEAMKLRRLRHHSPGQYLLHLLGERDTERLVSAIESGVPADALAVAARWWQLESYLRLLVYIQLRALLGPDWQGPLKKTAKRLADARDTAYMASADDEHLLAHLDVSLLFELIDEYWEQCSHGIGLPKLVWQGRIAEVKPIRHRIAHCRRPHADDVQRLEQLLRDLEGGANKALRAYVDWWDVNPELDDPMVEAWVRTAHPDARRLVDHGDRNKGIHFSLMAVHLPWAAATNVVTGTPGRFWVMHVVLSDGRRLYIDDYWAESAVRAHLGLAGHIIQPSSTHLVVTLPAVGDAEQTADALGAFFEAVFAASGVGDGEGVRHPWRRSELELDPRVDAEGLLSTLSFLNPEDQLRIFGAANS